MKRRRGFTLTEILVVLAILAILAALLFPVLMRAKGRAKETVCASNMRQLYVAIELYRQDWETGGGSTPALGFPTAQAFGAIQWKLFKKGHEICPASPWGSLGGYFYLPQWSFPVYGEPSSFDYVKYYEQEGPNAYVLADLNHNNPKDGHGYAHSTIKVTAVRCDGAIKQFRAKGDYESLPSSFWSPK